MAQNDNKNTSYFNTLIFTIVAGIISLLLLLALVFKPVRDHAMYFIIALEVGIFTIIAVCIYQIVITHTFL
jgi:uncharacterized membrane protein YhaH (DUF805 family)